MFDNLAFERAASDKDRADRRGEHGKDNYDDETAHTLPRSMLGKKKGDRLFHLLVQFFMFYHQGQRQKFPAIGSDGIYGVNWSSGPSADAVFDGGVDFLDDLLTGFTGGGQISAPVSGWTHKSTDGGQTWSQRLFNLPFPIRAVKLFNDTLGLAFGGNLYQEAGEIYITTDGGLNWNLDVNTSAEMFSYDVVTTSPSSMDVWCVGSTGGSTGFIGKLYKASIGTLVGIDDYQNNKPFDFQLQQNYPPSDPARLRKPPYYTHLSLKWPYRSPLLVNN